MQIEIIAIPPGDAPEWVRKKWLGCIFPVVEDCFDEPITDGLAAGALGGVPKNTDGYRVDTEEALRVLEGKSQEAANWWRKTMPEVWGYMSPQLVFKRGVCRVH